MNLVGVLFENWAKFTREVRTNDREARKNYAVISARKQRRVFSKILRGWSAAVEAVKQELRWERRNELTCRAVCASATQDLQRAVVRVWREDIVEGKALEGESLR